MKNAVKQAVEEAKRQAEAAAEEAAEEETAEAAEAEEADAQDAEEPEEDAEAAAEDGQEKKGLFGKKKKDKKDKKDIQIEELTDRVKRQMAEFDNFRKRTEKEKAAMFEVGAKSVVEKILPVIDNFERGLAGLTEEQKGRAVCPRHGDDLQAADDDAGEHLRCKPIEAVGKEFDPNLHNAVMHVEDENLGENVVAEEFQKGYTYK